MVLISSQPFSIGAFAIDFELEDVCSNSKKTLHELKSNIATVIMFICNHCPFVKHINKGIVDVSREYQQRNVAFIAISSNDAINYPEDTPDKMAEVAQKQGYTFPYLYDETQQVARAYNAQCTPEFFVFDDMLKCVYHGQMDASRPNNDIAVSGRDLRKALDQVLEGKPPLPNEEQIPSIGCSIKWKN